VTTISNRSSPRLGSYLTNSGSDHDFAADTLQLINGETTTPDPSTFLLIGADVICLWRKLR